jgi:hypothetical protein
MNWDPLRILNSRIHNKNFVKCPNRPNDPHRSRLHCTLQRPSAIFVQNHNHNNLMTRTVKLSQPPFEESPSKDTKKSVVLNPSCMLSELSSRSSTLHVAKRRRGQRSGTAHAGWLEVGEEQEGGRREEGGVRRKAGGGLSEWNQAMPLGIHTVRGGGSGLVDSRCVRVAGLLK